MMGVGILDLCEEAIAVDEGSSSSGDDEVDVTDGVEAVVDFVEEEEEPSMLVLWDGGEKGFEN